MDAKFLIGHDLNSIWLSRVDGHPAWVDDTTPAIQALFVNLDCAGIAVTRVLPCEVKTLERYPALGIELREVLDAPSTGEWYEGTQMQAEMLIEIAPFLPAKIMGARLWDALGEGPDSALELVLSTGLTITIRHIMPPMVLGIDVNMVVKP